MNRCAFAFGAATLAAVVLAAQNGATLDGATLRRTLTPNTTDTYKLTAKLSQSMDVGGQAMDFSLNIKGTVVMKTSTVDTATGLANMAVTQSVDSIDTDSPGPIADQIKSNIPKPVTLNATLDKLGSLKFDQSKLSVAEATSVAQFNIGAEICPQFPEKPLKVGDSWDVVIPKGPTSYPTDQTITAKLTGEQTLNGKPSWVVSFDGTIKSDVDMAKFSGEAPPSMPADAHITGTKHRTGTALIEKSTGRLLHMDATEKNTGHVEVPSLGQGIDVTTTSTTTIDLS